MKKGIKIGLIVVGILAVLVIAIAVGISPIAKNYIEKHDHELIGRTIRMNRLRANIFTGRLRIEGLYVSGADDSTAFFTLDSFDMRIRLLPIAFHKIDIRHIRLTNPDVKVYQKGSEFNFDGILDHFQSDTAEVADPDAKPWKIGIYNIAIRNGHIYYKDLLLNAQWGLNDISLTIPGVYFAGGQTDMGALLNFAEGGSLDTKVGYDIESSQFDIAVKLRNLALDNTLPYFRQSLDINGVKGRLSADVHFTGDAQHLLSLRTQGTASLSDFALIDKQDRAVAGVDTLGVNLSEANLEQMNFRLERLYAKGLSALFEITPEGNNLTALLKPTTPTQTVDTLSATQSPTPKLHISDLEIADSRIQFRDRTPVRPFEYQISDIRLHSRDFDPAARNNLTIDARMQKTGLAKLRWEGAIDDINNQDITLQLTNIDLRDFSPYCEQYTAYPVTHGNLSFRSQNIIRNRHLDGTNHLDVFEPKVEKKRKDLKPELHIPLRLGLYVLKDKKGHVQMDLPVKGSLDSPEFSYRKIVLKAIGNVLLKVVTAPFSFLSGNGGQLEYIALDPQQYEFTSEQYASFDKIGQMLNDKPEMQIALTQHINLNRSLPIQAANALRLAYASPRTDSLTLTHPKDTLTAGSRPRLSILEYEKMLQLDIRTPAITAYADSLLTARNLPGQGLSTDEKALVLFKEQAQEQLNRLMMMRNRKLTSYMQSTYGATDAHFKINPADSVAEQNYSGKDRYTIAIGVDGETVEVGSQTETPTAPAQTVE